MKLQSVDLHFHSTKSDGSCSPRELVQIAAKKQVGLIALADHDTVGGVKELQAHAQQCGISVITAVEMSTKYSHGTQHILGYGVDINDPDFLQSLAKAQRARVTRGERILSNLREAGVSLDLQEIRKHSNIGDSFGRPHIAAALLRLGYVQTIQEAFEQYIGLHGAAYVSGELYTVKEAIDIIHQAGGLAFVAHPVTLKRNTNRLQEYLGELKGQGLDGMEVYSSSHSSEQIAEYRALSVALNLLRSAGSDYHGTNKRVNFGTSYQGGAIQRDWVSKALLDRAQN